MRAARRVLMIVAGLLLLASVYVVGGRSLRAATFPEPHLSFIEEVPRSEKRVAFAVRKVTTGTKKISTKKKEVLKIEAPAAVVTALSAAPPPVITVAPPVLPLAQVQAQTPELAVVPNPMVQSPPPVSAPPPAIARIIIAEVVPGGERTVDEYIVLYNPGQNAVDLTGWSMVKITASGKHEPLVAKARFQGKTLQPNQRLVVARDEAMLPQVVPDIVWAKSNSLAAKNNGVILRNATGDSVDQAYWVVIPKGSKYVREPLMDGAMFVVQ